MVGAGSPPASSKERELFAWRSAMLVLTRRVGEGIVIGDNITVVVSEVLRSRVRISIQSPDCVTILRQELIADHVNDVRGQVPDAGPTRDVS
jgi:carbon storage regulator